MKNKIAAIIFIACIICALSFAILESVFKISLSPYKVEVTKWDLAVSPLKGVYIKGRIINKSPFMVQWAHIRYELYDKDGDYLTDSEVDIYNLKPHKEVEFETRTNDIIASFKTDSARLVYFDFVTRK